MSKLIQHRREARDLPAKITSYVVGLILSVLLTLLAYAAVVNQLWEMTILMWIIVGLAIVQLVVQLVFFLHLGQEKGTSWKMLTFWFAAMVVIILVLGSLWIMYHLNYNMMDMDAMKQGTDLHTHKGF